MVPSRIDPVGDGSSGLVSALCDAGHQHLSEESIALKVVTRWTEKMNLVSTADGHDVAMDAKSPLGLDSAQTPK